MTEEQIQQNESILKGLEERVDILQRRIVELREQQVELEKKEREQQAEWEKKEREQQAEWEKKEKELRKQKEELQEELRKQQKELEDEIEHYSSLLRDYRKVFEAEHYGLGYRPPATPQITNSTGDKDSKAVKPPATGASHVGGHVAQPDIPIHTVRAAVLAIMIETKGQPVHGMEVNKKVAERYPDLKQYAHFKSHYKAVLAALKDGTNPEQGIYERVERGVYRMKAR